MKDLRLLTAKDEKELAGLPTDQQAETKQKKLKEAVEPLWFFFFGLCLTLQSGENEMTPLDAYWLGLIDEVIGEQLPSPRRLFENTKADEQDGIARAEVKS